MDSTDTPFELHVVGIVSLPIDNVNVVYNIYGLPGPAGPVTVTQCYRIPKENLQAGRRYFLLLS